MRSKYLTDSQYATFISIVADQNGCRLMDIDFDAGRINLQGPIEKVLACTKELSAIMGADDATGPTPETAHFRGAILA